MLTYFMDMSDADVAATLGIKCGAVKKRKHNARARLQGLVGSDFWGAADTVPGSPEPEGTFVMSTYNGQMDGLDVALTQMGQAVKYPPTPSFAPDVLARVRTARPHRLRLLPARWPVRRRLVLIISLALVACAAVAYAILYPIPEGFDLLFRRASSGGFGKDLYLVTANDLEQLTSNSYTEGEATWAPTARALPSIAIAMRSFRPRGTPIFL